MLHMNTYTLVTGAAGGLGSALCEILLSRNGSVLAVDHNVSRLEALRKRLDHENFLPLTAELDHPELEALVHARLPGDAVVRGLVNIAAQSIGGDIFSLADADWERSFSVNVTPAMKLARMLVPRMRAAGGGSIVNVGSPVGIVGARKPGYAASKAALTGLTVSLARNLGPHGIRVNVLLPGPMITPLTEDWPESKRQKIAASSFLGRLCQPLEAARIIAFLLSEESSYVTGSVIDATAGSMFGH